MRPGFPRSLAGILVRIDEDLVVGLVRTDVVVLLHGAPHGRPWPCEWDVGREPDRDERSEPPTAAPPPGAIQTIKRALPNIETIKSYSGYLSVGTVPRP